MGLDDDIAAVYGVSVATAPILPLRSARPEAIVLAADQIALALDERRPRRRAVEPPAWIPLPVLPRAPAADAATELAALLRWAAHAGAEIDGAHIELGPDGNRSVRAARAFVEGDRVMAVPRDLMIVDADIEASTVGAAIAAVAGELRSGHTLTSAWLADQRARPDTRWRTYLDALPSQFAAMPMFHDAAAFGALRGTCARAAVVEAHASVVEDYDVIARLPALAHLTLAEFAWARAILASRAFKVDIAGEDRRALVPIADMFDHHRADATWFFDDEQQAFVVSALRTIAAGQPIAFSYGAYDNGRYLVGYGFAIAHNPEEEVHLRFAAAADAHADLVGHLLWDLPLGATASVPIATTFDERARRAMSVARLRASSPRERIAAADRGRFAKRELRWLGSRIELAALAELAAAARAGLKALARTPLPASPQASAWDATVETVRQSERATLEQIVAFTAAATRHVASPSRWTWQQAAEQLSEDTLGADRLLRGYLLATAAELPR